MSRTLIYTAWRYLLRHPWQSILMVTGITLGVAVVVAIDIANLSASRAFDLSTSSITGKSTHQIIGGPEGVDAAIYSRIRTEGIPVPSAPVISAYITSEQLGSRPMQMLGVDPFAEAPFRDYLGPSIGEQNTTNSDGLVAFLTIPGAILISEDIAQTHGLQACGPGDSIPNCRITLNANGQTKEVLISGLLKPSDSLSKRALGGIIIADISTAQELLARKNTIDRIDLIIEPEDTDVIHQLESLLPASTQIQPVAARSDAVKQMTAAFQLNLTALSLLALLVGMFLIYNTITFSVVQRRPMYGTLRCLGVTQREVFILVMLEAFVVGSLGAVLGIMLGVVLGQGAIRIVTQTINDLFFVLTVRGVAIPVDSLVKGAVLGITATLLSAAPPAYEAASVPPRIALSRSGLESKAHKAINLAAWIGVMMIAFGAILLFMPGDSLTLSFSGTFAIVVGFAMLVPISTLILMRYLPRLLERLFGVLGRMAPRDVASTLSRTSVAVMALMVAISVTIGVSLMIGSFRSTVVTWLEDTLQGDIYISAPGVTTTSTSTPLRPEIIEIVRSWPGIYRADVLQSIDIDSPNGLIHVAATDNFEIPEERNYYSLDADPSVIWNQLLDGAVIVSEPMANRLKLPRHGGEISMFTNNGLVSFPVVGIYYDYASTQGSVIMALPVYRSYWNDPRITAIALRLNPGEDPDRLSRQLEKALADTQSLTIRPNQALRKDVLQVFDRTFAITGALQLLATAVAFIGVLSALLSLELERQREIGILRSIGLTARQLFALISLETGLMGAVAGILSMPTGYILAIILVYIINRRSFGWTLQMQLDWSPFAQALLIAIFAAVLAGVYPAIKMGRVITSEALRAE